MKGRRTYTFSRILTYFEYNSEERLLTIAFNNGVVVDYCCFPEETYFIFERSDSYGKFYLNHIKGRFNETIRFE